MSIAVIVRKSTYINISTKGPLRCMVDVAGYITAMATRPVLRLAMCYSLSLHCRPCTCLGRLEKLTNYTINTHVYIYIQ